MNNINLDDLISKLKDAELSINDDTDNSTSFIRELDDIMSLLNPKNDVVDIKIKKLHPNAVIPSYSKDGDAGMDLVATKIISNTTFDITYGTGIAIEIPKGFVGLLFPRSSIRKTDLALTNSVGVIDSGYRGEIQATFKKVYGKNDVRIDEVDYKIGDRIAQIIIMPYPQVKFSEVEELSETDRGSGGFGSTGS